MHECLLRGTLVCFIVNARPSCWPGRGENRENTGQHRGDRAMVSAGRLSRAPGTVWKTLNQSLERGLRCEHVIRFKTLRDYCVRLDTLVLKYRTARSCRERNSPRCGCRRGPRTAPSSNPAPSAPSREDGRCAHRRRPGTRVVRRCRRGCARAGRNGAGRCGPARSVRRGTRQPRA